MHDVLIYCSDYSARTDAAEALPSGSINDFAENGVVRQARHSD